MKNFISKLILISSLFTASMSAQAASVPIAAKGTEAIKVVVSSTADIIATFLGGTALYSDDLFLSSDGGSTYGGLIFNNKTSSIGSTVNLGSFAIGTELIFKMIANSGKASYFTGGAERNKDGIAHARVQGDWKPGQTLVGFEDLAGGGDRDYDDVVISLSNTNEDITAVPVPAALWLMGSALFGLLGLSKRKV